MNDFTRNGGYCLPFVVSILPSVIRFSKVFVPYPIPRLFEALKPVLLVCCFPCQETRRGSRDRFCTEERRRPRLGAQQMYACAGTAGQQNPNNEVSTVSEKVNITKSTRMKCPDEIPANLIRAKRMKSKYIRFLETMTAASSAESGSFHQMISRK